MFYQQWNLYTQCVNRLLQSVNFVSWKRILASWKASGISAAVEDDLIGFLTDPFKEIVPFDQTIEINMTSVVWPMSEEYIDKEKVFRDYDSDNKFCDSENSGFNRE